MQTNDHKIRDYSAVSAIAGWRLRQPSPFLYNSSKPLSVLIYTSVMFWFSN